MGGEEDSLPSPSASLNITQTPSLLLCPIPPQTSPLFCIAETCTGQDLADLGDRLRDWFQLLRENSKQNGSASSAASPAGGLGTNTLPGVGWGGEDRKGPSRQVSRGQPASVPFLVRFQAYDVNTQRVLP